MNIKIAALAVDKHRDNAVDEEQVDYRSDGITFVCFEGNGGSQLACTHDGKDSRGNCECR